MCFAIEAREVVLRLMQQVPLTDEEKAVAEGDVHGVGQVDPEADKSAASTSTRHPLRLQPLGAGGACTSIVPILASYARGEFRRAECGLYGLGILYHFFAR